MRTTIGPAALLAVLLALGLGVGCAGSGGDGSSADGTVYAGLDRAGDYPVGVRTLDLVDESRPDDPYSRGPRFLKTEIWYPAAESARDAPPASGTDWIPRALAPLAPFLTIRGHHVFDFQTHAVRGADVASGRFPLVVFSHGNQAVRYQSFTLCEHLASHGFVVASPDHIGNAAVAERADGSLALYADVFGVPALDRRIADMRFVISTVFGMGAAGSGSFLAGAIDEARGVGITGHSFGGATTVATAAVDSRIRSAAPMAAAVFEDRMPPLTVPSLTWIGGEDKTVGVEANDAMRQISDASAPPRAFADLLDAGHFTFSDACVLLPGFFGSDGCGEGTRIADGSTFPFIGHDESWAILDATTTALFLATLTDDASAGAFLRRNPARAEVEFTTSGW
ncbi:MAG: hypothetical protein U0610_18500 [bacterium]